MNLTGETHIAAPRAKVWEALNDSEVLKKAIPGCEEISQLSDTELEAVVVAKVGPVKAKFKGNITLSEMDPPNAYVIAGEGTGGAAGFATGSARVTLTDEGNGTLLRYEVNAQVGGKLAQIGSRLIDGVAKKLAREFFESFSDLLARQKSAAAEQNEQIAVDPDVDRASLPVWLWASGVLAVAIGSLIYFSGILS